MHFLRLFPAFDQDYVDYHFIFPTINKRWVGIRAGGWKICQNLISKGGTIVQYSRVHIRSENRKGVKALIVHHIQMW